MPSIPSVSRIKAPVRRNLEEEFGTRWAVWLGGAALALGGIFLVQYSIEQGWLGPAVRVFFGALLAAALLAAGEWARRSEMRSAVAGVPAAHIPSILTAAGTVIAFATVFAAHVLYGFIGPGMAFALLGGVGLAALAASLVHGPWLAGLGLVGCYLTPALIGVTRPDHVALATYLGITTAATFGLAALRGWRWLAGTSTALGLAWLVPGIGDPAALYPHLLQIVSGFGLATILFVPGFGFAAPRDEPQPVHGALLMLAFIGAATFVVLAGHHDPVALATLVVMVGAAVAVALRTDAAVLAVPGAAAAALVVIGDWAINGPFGGAGPLRTEFTLAAIGQMHLVATAVFAAFFGGAGVLALLRRAPTREKEIWAASAVGAPLLLSIAAYHAASAGEPSLAFAAAVLVFAALFAFATERLARSAADAAFVIPVTLFATGSVAALTLSVTFALDGGWLNVGLALIVPGIAVVAGRLPAAPLRPLAAILVAIVAARTMWEPRIVGDGLAATPVLNALLYGYGGPALSFWIGGELLRRRADDLWAQIVVGAAIAFTAALVFVELRHALNGGVLDARPLDLAEAGAQISAGLALALCLVILATRTRDPVHEAGAAAMTWLWLGAALIDPMILLNPWLTGDDVGGPVFNLIALAFGLPAILAGAIALAGRATWSRRDLAAMASIAVALFLVGLLLQTTCLFRGPVLTAGVMSDGEWYAYSVVLLVFGVALLVAGLVARSPLARFASLAVLAITIGKVFLIDLAGLTGFLRALSFIGLGLVLVGIGWLYQRILFPATRAMSATGPVEGSAAERAGE